VKFEGALTEAVTPVASAQWGVKRTLPVPSKLLDMLKQPGRAKVSLHFADK
jgi:hypothetical protein